MKDIALTAAAADWLHSLPFEIEVIWTAKWNLVKILYILNRYFLADMSLYYVYLELADVETCRISFIIFGGERFDEFLPIPRPTQTIQVTALIGVALAEMVIFLRLYALSGQSPIYRIWLPLQFLAVQVTAYCLAEPDGGNTLDMPSPLPEYVACLPVSGTINLATALFGLLMANETTMVHVGLKKHRRTRSPLITTFYRDGIVFFLALAGSSIVNIVLLLSLPPSANTMFAMYVTDCEE
ncbi:hypothetical protein H1R20_g5019, partial [Candolleomyces eurysporus]